MTRSKRLCTIAVATGAIVAFVAMAIDNKLEAQNRKNFSIVSVIATAY